MGDYGLQYTPSLVVIDWAGQHRLSAFGHLKDLAVGTLLAWLIDEPRPKPGT